MPRTQFDNRLFLLGLCMMACSSAEETNTSLGNGTSGSDDDDSDSTTTGDTPSPTASAGTTVSTSLTSTTSDTSAPTDGSDSTMGIDPSETTVVTSDPTTSGAPESTTSGDDATTSEGTTGDTTGGSSTTGGDMVPCGPYAANYVNCFMLEDPEQSYEYGFFYCELYIEDCLGVSDECDTLIDEWISCVSLLECKEWDIPGCPDELDTLQSECGC